MLMLLLITIILKQERDLEIIESIPLPFGDTKRFNDQPQVTLWVRTEWGCVHWSPALVSSFDHAMQCGELFHAWEMWLSPHSEKPVGSKVVGQDPRPWTGSPMGNQACIVP